MKPVGGSGKEVQSTRSSDQEATLHKSDGDLRKPENIRTRSSSGKNGAVRPVLTSEEQLQASGAIQLQEATAVTTTPVMNSIQDEAGSSPNSDSPSESGTRAADFIVAANAATVPTPSLAADSCTPWMTQDSASEHSAQALRVEDGNSTESAGENGASASAFVSIPTTEIAPESAPPSLQQAPDAGLAPAANIRDTAARQDSPVPESKRETKGQAAAVAKMSLKASPRGTRDISDGDALPSRPQSAKQHEQAPEPAGLQQSIAVHEVQRVAATDFNTTNPVSLAEGAPASPHAGSAPDNHHEMAQAVPEESSGGDSGTITPGILSARLMQASDQSEMRVGMHSAEFGEISIHTSVSRQQMLAQISVEHSELRNTIAAHVPAIQWRLGSEYGVHASIEVSQGGYAFSGDQGQSSSRNPQQSTGATPNRDPVPEGPIDLSLRAPPAAIDEYRLDIRA